MKKSLSTLILISFITLFALPTVMPVSAAITGPTGPTGPTGSTGGADTAPTVLESPEEVVTLIETLTNWLFTILMAVAVIFIILAAWTFLTAGGNPDSVTKARQMLIYALIGVAVAILAKGLPIMIQTLLES